MSFEEILEEIPKLTSSELRVLIMRASAAGGAAWTPAQLTEAGQSLAAENDSQKAQTMKDQVIAGFYGTGAGA